MPHTSSVLAICDANVLLDYLSADRDLIRELVRYWGSVHVPDVVLHEVRNMDAELAAELGLTIVETPLTLIAISGLSGPDRSCLHFVLERGWTCLTNDRLLRRECLNRGGTVVWGLEMLIRLVDAEQITKERALDAAMTIRRVNPDFTPKLLQDFVSKLNGPENII